MLECFILDNDVVYTLKVHSPLQFPYNGTIYVNGSFQNSFELFPDNDEVTEYL